MESTLDARKQRLASSVINFLQDELVNGNLNDERKECIEVAIQCLETAFELDTDTRTELEQEKVDLLSFINITPKVEVSEEQKNQAEDCKNRGNTNMKDLLYHDALAEYTKAIQLNPTNAIYYCNRAAAFSRLQKHLEAIDDCKEAIKLDPSYGKAYGRLGIAYSKLNKFEDARKAFLTALKYDPDNTMYMSNIKLAEEKLFANMAAFSRLEKHPEAIDDRKEAIKLDPSYGKAYGRLGNTLSRLNKFEDARSAFLTASKYDPNNEIYEINAKATEKKLHANVESAAPPEHRPLDISQFINNINNPTLINMATHMLSDPSFRNIISGLMNVEESEDPNINVLLQAGQNLARRMETEDPNFVENLRRTFAPRNPPTGSPEDASSSSKNESAADPEKKME